MSAAGASGTKMCSIDSPERPARSGIALDTIDLSGAKGHVEDVDSIRAGDAEAARAGDEWKKYTALVLLMVQTTAVVLTMRVSMTRQTEPYLVRLSVRAGARCHGGPRIVCLTDRSANPGGGHGFRALVPLATPHPSCQRLPRRPSCASLACVCCPP